jgi:hypothetical protein
VLISGNCGVHERRSLEKSRNGRVAEVWPNGQYSHCAY